MRRRAKPRTSSRPRQETTSSPSSFRPGTEPSGCLRPPCRITERLYHTGMGLARQYPSRDAITCFGKVNQRHTDFQSETRLVSLLFTMTYKRFLRQERGLQVVDK